jgi:ABC-type polysaccharide/polyol phosphate transport system ATPase subunit
MKQVSEQGRMIFFVSHDLASLRQFCSRGLLIEDGPLVADADAASVTDLYLRSVGVNGQ